MKPIFLATDSLGSGVRKRRPTTKVLWKEISQKFEALGGLNQKVRSMQWKILGNALVSEFEVGERMTLLIPQILRDFANLAPKKHVSLVGMGSKFKVDRPATPPT